MKSADVSWCALLAGANEEYRVAANIGGELIIAPASWPLLSEGLSRNAHHCLKYCHVMSNSAKLLRMRYGGDKMAECR